MWSVTDELLPGGRGRRYVPARDGRPITYAEAVDRWRADVRFRTAFTSWLADAPLAGFRWETPPVTTATIGKLFEFVLLPAAGFGTRPDAEPFADAFRSAPGTGAVAFPNLGRDAILVAPCPTSGLPAASTDPAYTDLAAFTRRAADAQHHAFWQTVATAVRDRLDDRPLWLSTAGLGVAWLHVRIDDRPKYYGHAPYRVVAP